MAEELEFVVRCMQRAAENKQADYDSIDHVMDTFRKNPYSRRTQDMLTDMLKAALVMHIFYDETVDSSYTNAIRAWMTTISIE